MHHDGIDFAMTLHMNEDQPRYLSFLEVLGELSHKLIEQDRMALIQYLEGHLKRCKNTADSIGPSYLTYKQTLENGKTTKRANMSRGPTNQKKNIPKKKPSLSNKLVDKSEVSNFDYIRYTIIYQWETPGYTLPYTYIHTYQTDMRLFTLYKLQLTIVPLKIVLRDPQLIQCFNHIQNLSLTSRWNLLQQICQTMKL